MKRYSPVILGIALLLLSAGCDLTNAYRPQRILGYPSPSESTIQWGDSAAKVTAEIISVDVECVPAGRGKTGIEYEIAATAHISYQIIDRKFFKKATAFSDLEANLIFEPVTAPGSRLAIVRGVVKLVENADTTTTSVKIPGFSAEELKRIVGVQARWE